MAENTSTIKIEYRTIAKMLCRNLPLTERDFTIAVEDSLKAIKRLDSKAKLALKMAYIFSRKVPMTEREDLFQDLALKLLESKRQDEKLSYAIARCDWQDWWKAFRVRSNFNWESLNSEREDDDGNTAELGDLIVGECEFEAKIADSIDANKVYNSLPKNIQTIVMQRLQGIGLKTSKDKMTLKRFLDKNGATIRAQLVTA